MSKMSDLDLQRQEVCEVIQIDQIGPLLRGLEGAVDDLQSVNPLRLSGDVERLTRVTVELIKLTSAIRHAHRKHGMQAAE